MISNVKYDRRIFNFISETSLIKRENVFNIKKRDKKENRRKRERKIERQIVFNVKYACLCKVAYSISIDVE